MQKTYRKRGLLHAKRANSTGQLAGQILMYLLGIITVGLILLLGMKAINQLQDKQCTVKDLQFQTDLASAIEKDKDAGVNRVESFSLPCNTVAVCFVSRSVVDAHAFPDPDGTGSVAKDAQTNYPTIYNSVVNAQAGVNVFSKTESGGFDPLERFSVSAAVDLPESTPIICMPGSANEATNEKTSCTGDIKIRFLGKGRSVEVRDEGCN